MNCFQLRSTGTIIKTEQEIAFNEKGTSVDRSDWENSINGFLYTSDNKLLSGLVINISFNKKDVLLSWSTT